MKFRAWPGKFGKNGPKTPSCQVFEVELTREPGMVLFGNGLPREAVGPIDRRLNVENL